MLTRRPFFLITAVLLSCISFGQDHWAYRVGGFSNDALSDLVLDGSGNMFVTGEFGGNVALDGVELISQGSLDIVVAKFEPTGQLVWTKTFGGPGLDRGVSLALGATGDLFVTGQFMGTVAFDGTELISQGGTQDMFIARLSASDGSVVWAHQGGSADGVDTPNDIAVGGDQMVVITGEFRGTGVFDAGTITSITDPETMSPSVDIFVAAYNEDGDPLWLKHGSAEFADRGLTVVLDAVGNSYVSGQFSDTLTFDLTHNNAMYAAVFIVRFDPLGNESWFRIFGGGTYNQVGQMILVGEDRLLLTGDVQGTVIYLDEEPDLFSAVAPRSSFLLEVDTAGTFLRQVTWGSENTLNTRSLSVHDDDVVVYGRFQCQFTGFSTIYGAGTWLATGQYDLYAARFGMENLEYKEAQQFGGQKNKVPGRVVHTLDGEVVFCGAFDRLLVFPNGVDEFHTTPPEHGVSVPSVPPGVCDDPNYGVYAGLRGYALMDGFLARGWVDGREPYDIFDRPNADCDRPQRDAYIRMNGQGIVGPDSVRACVEAYLFAFTNTAYTPDTSWRHTAPDMVFDWNTGADSVRIRVTTSGWYVVNVSSAAGCWDRYDSLYVTIDPLPPLPLVNDDVVVNTNAVQASTISVCEPQLPWLWATGLDPANTVSWSGPPGSVANDSIQATVSGIYTVTVTTPFGCILTNRVQVIIIPSGPLPDLDALYSISFPQDPGQTDTVRLCSNVALNWRADVDLQLDGVSVGLPYGVRMLRNCNGLGWNLVPSGALVASCSTLGYQEGWFHSSIGIMLTNAPCGTDTLIFWENDSVYVVPYPVTYPTVSMTAPAYLCPGDTVTLAMNCTNCEQVDWNGPGIVADLGESIRVVLPGSFNILVTHLDTNGCVTTANTARTVEWNPRPLLGVLPEDGIICPNGEADIFSTSPGLSYQWYGPLGPLGVNNDTISTSQQGAYYLEMIDLLGCMVTSDQVLVTDYATPYLNVIPDNAICGPDETSTLQVVTTGGASLQWSLPLSGNALQQVVDEPGIYTCSVNACNITTVLSVEVFGNNAVAELEDPGPFILCPDESVELQALPGMTLYYWLPGPVVGPNLLVDETGTYTLVATDIHGCKATTSASVQVIPWTEALVANDTVICAGTPIVFDVPGSGLITWFADASMTEIITTGNVLDLGIPQESVTVYAQQQEGECTSALRSVTVTVWPYPQEPIILGPDTACEGAPIALSVTAAPGEIYTWTTPNGSYTGAVWELDPAVLDATGTYSVVASNPGCTVPGALHTLTMVARIPVQLAPDTMICPGGVATYTISSDHTSPIWNDGTEGYNFATAYPGVVIVTAMDLNGCSVIDSAWVDVFAVGQPLSAPAVTICEGDDAAMVASGSGDLVWFADNGMTDVAYVGASWSILQPTDSSIYYVVQTEWLCTSGPFAVPLNVVPLPNDMQMLAPTSICAGESLFLELVGDAFAQGVWTTPTGPYVGTSVTIAESTSADQGVYTVVPFLGPCPGDTLTAVVRVLIPMPPDIGPDTVFCDGGAYVLSLPPGYTSELWSTGSNGTQLVVTEPGTYGVSAIDAQGCAVHSEVVLDIIHCDPYLPNVITPNGDGVNDEWALLDGPFKTADLQVFNRFGDPVWEGDPSRKAFNGVHYLRNEPLSAGVYFYVLRMDRYDDGSREVKGYLQIFR